MFLIAIPNPPCTVCPQVRSCYQVGATTTKRAVVRGRDGP